VIPLELLCLAASSPSDKLTWLLYLRLPKMCRLAHLPRHFATCIKLCEKHHIHPHSASVNAAKLSVMTCFLVNWIASLWFLIAAAEEFTPTFGGIPSWVVQDSLVHATPLRRYVRSLYWAVQTMTMVGYGEFHPRSVPSMLLAIVAMLSGSLVYSGFIAAVQSNIRGRDTLAVAFRCQREHMSQFLKSRNATPTLKWVALSAFILKGVGWCSLFYRQRINDWQDLEWMRSRGMDADLILREMPLELRKVNTSIFARCPLIFLFIL
jgi:hypothetical protein